MEGESGQLEQEFRSHPPESTDADEPPCREPVTIGVTEIGLERTPCFGFCPTYTVLFRVDGTAEYWGQGNVPRVGHYRGKLDIPSFVELAALALDIGFMDQFEADYGCLVTDNPTVFVLVASGQGRKIIRHYAPKHSGPLRLIWFERWIDVYADRIKWERVKP